MDKEPIYFEVGDTVYHWKWGEGIVTSILENATYPVWVNFPNVKPNQCFTNDGKHHRLWPATLSQTPYDFVNGGFTLKAKIIIPKIKKGTLVYVSDGSEWIMRYFSHFDKEGLIFCYDYQKKTGNTCWWQKYSLTNPLLDE